MTHTSKTLFVFVSACIFVSLYPDSSAQTLTNAGAETSETSSLSFDISAQEHAKVKLFLGLINPLKWHGVELAAVLQSDLMFSEQFEVAIGTHEKSPDKSVIKKLHADGYLLALFINAKSSNQLEWRLYDTQQASMVAGKTYAVRGNQVRGWAHNIADAVWPQLTSQEPFFSTKIAYCKDVKLKDGHRVKHICMADFDGTHEEELVNVPTVTVAPRWNHDLSNPLLFYSEFTTSNIRLMTIDMKKTRRIASNFEGINMVPSFNADGTKGVYCASRGDGTCQLYYFGKGVFNKLTHNNGANVSPTMSGSGDEIYFASDFEARRPQIYKYSMLTQTIDRITSDGYCATPALNGKRNCLAYTKKVGREMQVFILDLQTKEHAQLTFDAGSKQECAWSPCGNYLLYHVEKGDSGRIVMYNMITTTQKYLTDESFFASYPAWSPLYNQFPSIQA